MKKTSPSHFITLVLTLFSVCLISEVYADYFKAKDLYDKGLYSESFYHARHELKSKPGDPALLELAEKSYRMEQNRLLRELEMAKQMQRTDSEVEVEKRMLAPRRSLSLLEVAGERKWIDEDDKKDSMLDQRLSLNLTGADLSYVLGLLFRATGTNLIADEELLDGKRMSIHVENIPVRDILAYMARTLGVSYTVSGETVWITATDKPILQERVYELHYGLTAMGQLPLRQGGGGAGAGAGGGGGLAAAAGGGGGQGSGIQEGESDSEKLVTWIEGWPEWPEGSTWRLDQRMGRLYLLTTPEMHKRVATMLASQDAQPTQISIMTRFVDMGVDDLTEFGVEWKSNNPTAIGRTHNNNEQDKFQIASGTGFTSSPNTASGLNLLLTGVLSSPQFDAVLHFLETNQDTNVLSSPQVLTLNNEPAQIAITDEFGYADEFEPISSTTTGGNTATESTTGFVPTEFTIVNDVGITLNVLPSVGKDKSKILLTLNPRIKSFREFGERNIVFVDNQGNTQTQIIQQPLFSNREITSKAIVNSGDTVVLGGLMTKTEAENVTKVPFFSNIPILGTMFRNQTKTDRKQNLMIFVTANIVSPNGDEKISPTAKKDPFRVPTESAVVPQPKLPLVNVPAPAKEAVQPVVNPKPMEKPTATAKPSTKAKKANGANPRNSR